MTELLDTIDAAIADWEAQPEAWNPGDPLHDHPHQRERAGEFGVQHVRPMLQVIDSEAETLSARCEPCQVTWVGIAACWICGEERPPRGHASSGYQLMVEMRADVRPWQRAMHDVAERMARIFDERAEAAIAEHAEQVLEQARTMRPRGVVTFSVPTVEDITAPTFAELARGIDLSNVVLHLDPVGGGSMVAAVIRRPDLARTPSARRLAIDGRAYRRRTLARRRRNR